MPFHVVVQPSGRSFSVNPDETVLAAGIRQNVSMPYGCKDGACGSCKCKMLAGQVQMLPYQSKALSEEEKAQGLILTCRALPSTDLELQSRQVSREDAFEVRKMPARVSAVERMAHDVIRLTLQLPVAQNFQYHAGQYVEIILRDGDRRAYSMATVAPPGEAQRIELHLRHMPGGKFTDHVFSALKEKDILRLEGPFGSFHLRESSNKPMIFLASGTGFAPIKALIERTIEKGISRPIALYWGGRRPADLYMNAWVEALCAQLPHLRYVPVISDALPQDHWSARTGFVHQAVVDDFPDLGGYQVYACGAPIVVSSARADFIHRCGLPEEEFFADSFETAADKVQA